MPYYMGLVRRAWDESNVPYQAYEGERLAGFTPMQNQAAWQAANQQLPGQIGVGSQMAVGAAQQTPQQQQGYNAMSYALGQGGGAGFTQGSQAIRAGILGAAQTGPTGATALGMGQHQDLIQRSLQAGDGTGVSTQRFTAPGVAESYMDPYIRNVIDIQKREANRDFAQQSQNVRAQTGMRAGVGGIGGYRDQVLQAEMNRNQAQRLDDIEAKGMQDAYARAAQQFNTDEQRLLDAAQRRGQIQLQGIGQAGQLANQYLNADQFTRQLALQSAGQMGQLGQSLANLGLDQSRFYGQLGGQLADAGRADRGVSLDAARTLGTLGGQQFDMERGLTDQLNRYGEMQQQQQQRFLDQQYNDFLTQRAAAREDLQFLSAILRGQNLGGEQIRQDPRPSGLSQVTGAGLSGLALYNMLSR
jgi:hypothetical protein